jgi:hypothetical protein
MQTSVKLPSADTTERAKQLWHTFYKKSIHNFFSAKDDALTLIETYIRESRFGNHLEAVSYWEEVRKAALQL